MIQEIRHYKRTQITKKAKICGILQEVISYNQKDYLIVGIGLNTNFSPKNKSFPSTPLKNMINKNIDNKESTNYFTKCLCFLSLSVVNV